MAVAERSEVEDRAREAERVADGDEVEFGLAGAERFADIRQRDVGDGEVEVGDRGDEDQRREDERRALWGIGTHRRPNLTEPARIVCDEREAAGGAAH
jgi:hypothetical protein